VTDQAQCHCFSAYLILAAQKKKKKKKRSC
jgi:hypothetical protein